MSWAFDAVCERLAIPETADARREMVALRIVELARKGERDPKRLRQKYWRADPSSLRPLYRSRENTSTERACVGRHVCTRRKHTSDR
jgi:hypothetical protein